MLKKLLFLLLLIAPISSFAQSDETWVHAGMWSHHYNLQNKNENHELFGIEYKKWIIADYLNSEFRTVKVFGKYLENCDFNYGKVTICAGTMMGIGDIEGIGVKPYIVPNIKLNYGRVGTEIDVLPEVIAIRFKYKIF